MDKLYVVTRRDLSGGAQAVQSCHAALQFAAEHPELTGQWLTTSNHLALLSVSDEGELRALVERAGARGIRCSVFREPDLDDQVTAAAFEPGRGGGRLCCDLPLTLAPVAQR